LSDRIRALFGTYVDGRVRDRIISADGHLGESKEVAILFSDIRNFTPITESSPAQGIVEMLNTYFTAWDVVSDAHGGFIDKFIGDAVMIVFETRKGRDAARDAVACAVSMLGSLDSLRQELVMRQLPVLWDIGVGISLGNVIMGNIGSERRRNYTVIGDTVNTASRLEAACKDHHRHLIVSQAVYERLDEKGKKRFSCLGDIPLKGKSETVHAYGA
jgi:adenylate cyclase